MSHSFDDFFPEEPAHFEVSQFENDNQRKLRERYDSLAARSEIDILFFDPKAERTFQQIMIRSGEEACEEAEPKVTNILMRNMLRQAGLDAPTNKNDPRYLADQVYKNGTRSTVFYARRSDRLRIPVYSQTETDGITPQLVCLMSNDLFGETVVHYRQLDKHRNQFKQRMKIGENILLQLSTDDLRDYTAMYDDIQRL